MTEFYFYVFWRCKLTKSLMQNLTLLFKDLVSVFFLASIFFIHILIVLDPWEERGNISSVGSWVEWSVSRKQTKTATVCLYSAMCKTADKQQIFHVNFCACKHFKIIVCGSSRADFLFTAHYFSFLCERQWGQDSNELGYSQGEKNIFRKNNPLPQKKRLFIIKMQFPSPYINSTYPSHFTVW